MTHTDSRNLHPPYTSPAGLTTRQVAYICSLQPGDTLDTARFEHAPAVAVYLSLNARGLTLRYRNGDLIVEEL